VPFDTANAVFVGDGFGNMRKRLANERAGCRMFLARFFAEVVEILAEAAKSAFYLGKTGLYAVQPGFHAGQSSLDAVQTRFDAVETPVHPIEPGIDFLKRFSKFLIHKSK
jgi:hypothetical protein